MTRNTQKISEFSESDLFTVHFSLSAVSVIVAGEILWPYLSADFLTFSARADASGHDPVGQAGEDRLVQKDWLVV